MTSNKGAANSRPESAISDQANVSFEGSHTCLQSKNVEKKDSTFKKIINVVWAASQRKEGENNSDLLIKTTLKELIIYVVYLVVISIITFGMTNSINFYFTNIMMNLFLQQNTNGNPGVNFEGMGGMQDFWDVNQGPIMDGLYWETWYNGENSTRKNFIYFENKLLGVPRLRQLRVKKNSCKVHKLFQQLIPDCYDVYSYFTEDQSPFGIYNGNTSKLENTAWYYQGSDIVQAPIVSGLVSTYGGGGYIKNLGLSKAESISILNDLSNNNWLDRGTRAIFLDFTIYNANINLFCQIRLITEFPSTGGVVPSWAFRTVKLIRYVTPMDYFILACEIIFVAFTLYYTIEEIIMFFKEGWNIINLVTLIVSYICISFNIYRVIRVNEKLDSLLADSSLYPEFDSLAYWQQQFNYAIAVTAFLSWIKIFKYVSFNKTMNQLSSTLSRCAKDIFGFSIMFFIVFFAYAQLGYLLFGSTVPDYSTFINTMLLLTITSIFLEEKETLFTLGRIILGDFDFPTLESASKVMGPIYFFSYVFFVFFVLLNMFLAIINDTYSDVKSDIANSTSEFDLGEYFKRGYNKILTKMNLKKSEIIDIQNILDLADQTGQIDFEKWRAELRNRGFADTEIEAYFAKYDTDGNKNLTEEEQKAMRADLKRQLNDIDNEMDKIKNEPSPQLGAPNELTQEEIDRNEMERKANLVSNEEFKILTMRVDTMESSIGNIVNRIDSVLNNLEAIERAKLKRREAMAKILDKLNEANSSQDESKRIQLQKMVKEELEKWDEPLSTTPTGLSSRAASPRAYTPAENFGRKSAWRQQ